MMNNCGYDTAGKHNCKHQHYCILNSNRGQLEHEIIQLSNQINELKHVKDCFINGELIYREELAYYYVFDTTSYVGSDGDIHFKVGVDVKDGFMGAVKRKIKNLEYDLKNLERFREDVLHGKVDGYGYGDD